MYARRRSLILGAEMEPSQELPRFCNPEDEHTIFLRNVGFILARLHGVMT
jgi:hypothetical protein